MAGTWRTFATQKDCQAYCDAVWIKMIRGLAVAASPQQTNTSVIASWAADYVAVQAQITALSPAAAAAVTAAITAISIKGVNIGGQVVGGGASTAWAQPRQTLAGTWAAPCPSFDAGGGAEPAWPVIPFL